MEHSLANRLETKKDTARSHVLFIRKRMKLVQAARQGRQVATDATVDDAARCTDDQTTEDGRVYREGDVISTDFAADALLL